MNIDLETLGSFDVVLFLGVLYHLEEPFLALRRLRRVTRQVAVIETGGVVLPGWTQERLWMFVEGAEVDNDPTNWWMSSTAGLAAMCRAAGFSDTKVLCESEEDAPPNPGYNVHFGRITMQALV
jgi:tRNA (mo5U34)-methyltransferase